MRWWKTTSERPAPTPASAGSAIIGASGKLGRYMVRHCLDRGYDVIGVCREQSVDKLAEFDGRITVVPGATNDREVIRRAVAGCDGVLTVLVPFGVHHYATGTAQAVLDFADPGARLVFSCGWHITRDGQDVYRWQQRASATVVGWLARLVRFVDVDDQVGACQRVFASDTRWTVVRGSDLEKGESQGLPVWSRHVGDPILASNRTRRVDFALFMVEALNRRRARAGGARDRRTSDAVGAHTTTHEPDAALAAPHMRSQEGEPAMQSMIEASRLVKGYGQTLHRARRTASCSGRPSASRSSRTATASAPDGCGRATRSSASHSCVAASALTCRSADCPGTTLHPRRSSAPPSSRPAAGIHAALPGSGDALGTRHREAVGRRGSHPRALGLRRHGSRQQMIDRGIDVRAVAVLRERH